MKALEPEPLVSDRVQRVERLAVGDRLLDQRLC
jgi:hypothetical protein